MISSKELEFSISIEIYRKVNDEFDEIDYLFHKEKN
jgi:hypothetical protein